MRLPSITTLKPSELLTPRVHENKGTVTLQYGYSYNRFVSAAPKVQRARGAQAPGMRGVRGAAPPEYSGAALAG